LIAVCLCAGLTSAQGAGGPVIVLSPAKTPRACIEVRGLPIDVMTELRRFSKQDPRWPQILAIHVAAANDAHLPPMLGSYELTTDGIRFRPRFPLERGLTYRVNFDFRIQVAQTFAIPAASGERARVLAVYPSAGELPENLLRFYVQFSVPMSQGDAYRRVRLRNETTGAEVVRPFLELPQELWSTDGTRLTLLLEPGRVKSGLAPREELGPILISGHKYSVAVDASWPDAEGRPLTEGYRKTFQAVKAVTRQLDSRSWVFESPAAGSRQPLSVRFSRPLDHAMLERVFRVERANSVNASPPGATQLTGDIQIVDEEKCWRFKPRDPWTAGRYTLLVPKNLEDPSGNNLGRPFEVDLNQSQAPPTVPPFVRIEFAVGTASKAPTAPLLGLEHK
jgi:hypothetical protein